MKALFTICCIVGLAVVLITFVWSATFRCEDDSGITVLTDSPAQLQNCSIILTDTSEDYAPSKLPSFKTSSPANENTGTIFDPLKENFGAELNNNEKTDSPEEESHTITVPMTSIGGSLTVPVQLNGEQTVQLILDTGATMTVLSTQVANELGITSDPLSQVTTVNTAGGPIQVNLTHLHTVEVGKAKAQNVSVAVHDLPDAQPDIDGLLGMSFLKHFLVTLDTKQRTLHLRPR